MHALVRKTLEIYIKEKRVITQSDFPADVTPHLVTKDSVFVTLYHNGSVIASSGRIQCKKENTAFECIDNTLLCLKDARFLEKLQTPEFLEEIYIRTDTFASNNRRLLKNINELDITKEGILFLSQNLGVMSIILPHMVHVGSTPAAYFSLACKKAWVDETRLIPADYVIYWLRTNTESDFS